MSSELATTQPQAIQTNKGAQTIEDALKARSAFLATVLPKHLTAERMIKVALLARSRNPDLLKCTQESLLKAVLQCAEMGLEPSGSVGGAHLVPFRNNKTGNMEATVVPDYRGLIDLARRSGQIRTIEAHVIHASDEYEVVFGAEPRLVHRPTLVGDPGEMIAVYAVAKLADGGSQVEVMTRSEVDRIKSKSKTSSFGPWITDYEPMAKKTVIKQLCKYVPRSREMLVALEVDDANETGEVPFAALELPADIAPKPSRSEKVRELARATKSSAGIVDVPEGMTEAEAIAQVAESPEQSAEVAS